MGVTDVGRGVEDVLVGGRDVHVAADHRLRRLRAELVAKRGEPGELVAVAVVVGVGDPPVGEVDRVDADAAAARRQRAGLPMGGTPERRDPDGHLLEPAAREDRDPVPLGLSVAGDRVAAGGELACEQLVERRVGELGLLQADDVGLALVEPRQQAREPLLGRVDVPGRDPHRAYASDSLRRGSGYEQAKAKLRCIESDEVAVAFGPPTRCEVITEAAHCPLLGLRPDSGPHRYSPTDMIVQVGLGPAPVGLEEAVRAVPQNEHRLHPGSDRAGHLGQRRPPYERPRAGSRE